jgi:GNAT superfamily N-acetyltransferase
MTTEDWAHGAALLHDHLEWTRVAAGVDLRTHQPAVCDELDELRSVYGPGSGALFVARLGVVPVGVVGMRHHGDGSVELKRMFLRPVARGRGLADELIAALLCAAASEQAHTVWLETLPGPMDPAISVYRRNGFTIVPGQERTIAVDGLIRMERAVAATERCA